MTPVELVNQPWKSLMVAGWTPTKAIELAIAIEDQGASTYRVLAEKWITNKVLGELFRRLESDEADHGEKLRRLLAGIDTAASRVDGLGIERLKGIANGFFTSSEGFGLSGIEHLREPNAILKKTLGFERATLDFYRGLKDILGQSQELDRMISDEKQHAADILLAIASN
jgi:rubrerythrin